MNTIPIRPFAAAKFLILAVLALALLLLNGCRWVGVKGDGNITTENRPVGNFTTLEADGAFEVKWSSGPPSLSITTDQNLLQYLNTRIAGEKLRIEWIKPLKGTRGIKVNVTSPTLTGAELNGAVRLVASNLTGDKFYLDATGATRVALNGTVNGLVASMTGASRLDADSLQTQTSELAITGAGRAEVAVTETLKVAISGAGKVVYVGDPKTVERQISGAGSVKRR
jgi:hypothetical protein